MEWKINILLKQVCEIYVDFFYIFLYFFPTKHRIKDAHAAFKGNSKIVF